MTIATIGNHTVSSCPYCDQLITSSGDDAEERLRKVLAEFREHLTQSPKCKEAYASSALGVLESIAAAPEFLDELRPSGRVKRKRSHDPVAAVLEGEAAAPVSLTFKPRR